MEQPRQQVIAGRSPGPTTGSVRAEVASCRARLRDVASRGEVWWAFGAERSPVVILSSPDESDLCAIYVVPAAEGDMSGDAIELPVGSEEGVPAGVVRVALARPDRIPCAWLVSLNETDLDRRAGALSEGKVSQLGEMLRLGGLE